MGNNKETVPQIMTARSKEALEHRLRDALSKAEQKGKALGESMESAQDWHDNPAYDTLLQELDVLDQRIKRLTELLESSNIIEPRKIVDQVAPGNTVVVQYEDQDEPEKFTILGEADSEAGIDPNWISFRTPLAVALLGMHKGSKITLDNGLSVQLLEILPGEF